MSRCRRSTLAIPVEASRSPDSPILADGDSRLWHTESVETEVETAETIMRALANRCLALGLDVDEPKLLRAGANTVVHLAPSPVVARVATLTADMRNDGAGAYLRREREICRALVDRGLRVIPPTDLIDPGPHRIGGRAFLLLAYQRLEPVDLDDPDHAGAAGRALVEIVRALADLPSEIGVGDEGHPWAEIDTLCRTVAGLLDPAAMAAIDEVLSELRATEPDDPWQLVHGDAHKGNVALDPQGEIVWFDFEDANRRPLAWDLASLCRAWPMAGDEACRLLGVDRSSTTMRWHHEFRDVYALLWALLFASRNDHAREASDARLAEWLARQPAP